MRCVTSSRSVNASSSRGGTGARSPRCSGSFLEPCVIGGTTWRLGLPAIPAWPTTLATTPQQRNEVIRLIDELGPGIGLPTLRLEFTGMAQAELEDILRRYRRVWRKRNQRPIRVLHWTRPGLSGQSTSTALDH